MYLNNFKVCTDKPHEQVCHTTFLYFFDDNTHYFKLQQNKRKTLFINILNSKNQP